MRMAIVVKWLTQRIVAPSLVGSNPISRPIEKRKSRCEAFFVLCRTCIHHHDGLLAAGDRP